MYTDDEGLQDAEVGQFRRAPRMVVWFVGLGLLGLVMFLALQSAPRDAVPGAVPEFDLPLLSGDGSVSSADLENRPVVLNFWASWCGPCREEAPLIERLWKEYEDRGVVILGVVSQDTVEDAREFVNEMGLTYTMVRDPGSELFEKLQLLGLPQTLFVTAEGILLDEGERTGGTLGAITEKQLRAGIEALLAQAPQ